VSKYLERPDQVMFDPVYPVALEVRLLRGDPELERW
jgi:hypothetical protein